LPALSPAVIIIIIIIVIAIELISFIIVGFDGLIDSVGSENSSVRLARWVLLFIFEGIMVFVSIIVMVVVIIIIVIIVIIIIIIVIIILGIIVFMAVVVAFTRLGSRAFDCLSCFGCFCARELSVVYVYLVIRSVGWPAGK